MAKSVYGFDAEYEQSFNNASADTAVPASTMRSQDTHKASRLSSSNFHSSNEAVSSRKLLPAINAQTSQEYRKWTPRYRTRMELPMGLRNAQTDVETINNFMTRPDSGSEENTMTVEVAAALRLSVDHALEYQKDFRLANGKSIKSAGRVTVYCSFSRDRSMTELRCFFYIFQWLISPVIMGMRFLDETETLSKYRHRLQSCSIPPALPIQLCSLDYPRRRLYCLADSQPHFANADTGSEVDLMSLAYVQRRRFTISSNSSHHNTVQFVDGSTSQLAGKVLVAIQIGANESPRYWREFHILDGLTCDILLGEEFLVDTAAFESYATDFALDDEDDGVPEVNAVVWFNLIESKICGLFGKKGPGAEQRTGMSLPSIMKQNSRFIQLRVVADTAYDFQRKPTPRGFGKSV